MKISFIKMHGIGNDFILIDCIRQAAEAMSFDPEKSSSKFCHRRFGIGADQLLLLHSSEIADYKMRIFNADGSEVEMCGNGIRCLAKYIWDKGLSSKNVLEIETLAGVVRPERSGDMVRVDMGEPIFEPEKIPVNISQESAAGSRQSNPPQPIFRKGGIVDYPLNILDREFKITCLSMGNPHAVIFLDEDISEFPVHLYGAEIENYPIFPKKTNVEFVNLKGRNDLNMRVWERGSGETMACGTGASATGVAAMLKQLTERKVFVHLPGGDLLIEWDKNNHVYMTGPAVEVFEGNISV